MFENLERENNILKNLDWRGVHHAWFPEDSDSLIGPIKGRVLAEMARRKQKHPEMSLDFILSDCMTLCIMDAYAAGVIVGKKAERQRRQLHK